MKKIRPKKNVSADFRTEKCEMFFFRITIAFFLTLSLYCIMIFFRGVIHVS